MERKSIFHQMEIEIDEKNDIELLQSQEDNLMESIDKTSQVKEEQTSQLQISKINKKDLIGLDLGLIDGYLLHKELAGYNKKFFMIKDEKLFWSRSESNIRETKKVLDIKTLKRCEFHKECGFILIWAQKVFRIKAANSKERDDWVRVIKTIQEKEQSFITHLETSVQPVLVNSLFEDCEPEWTPNQRDVAILLKLEKQESPTNRVSAAEGKKRRATMFEMGVNQPVDESLNDVSITSEKKKSMIKKLFNKFF